MKKINRLISFGNVKYRIYFPTICQELSLAFILNTLAYYRMEENNTNIKELMDKEEVVMSNNLAGSII